jgi:hypothetical protein
LKITGLFAVFILLFSSFPVQAQSRPNMELISKILNNSVTKIDSVLGKSKTINLSLTVPQPLEILRSEIIQAFAEHGYTLKTPDGDGPVALEYTLFSVRVEYKNAFSDGLFGGTMLERVISVNSTIICRENKTVISSRFKGEIADTVRLNEIGLLENPSLPFTQAPIPSLPFLSNLWEPIIVAGTLIVTVILLFTVRSK